MKPEETSIKGRRERGRSEVAKENYLFKTVSRKNGQERLQYGLMPGSMALDFHPKETCEKVPFNKKKSQNIFHIKRFKDLVPEDLEQKEVRDPEREKK